jgi:hypothetical protein
MNEIGIVTTFLRNDGKKHIVKNTLGCMNNIASTAVAVVFIFSIYLRISV